MALPVADITGIITQILPLMTAFISLFLVFQLLKMFMGMMPKLAPA